MHLYRNPDTTVYAAAFRKPGKHTSINQDHYHVRPHHHRVDADNPDIVEALIADGVTGRSAEERLLTGDFIARPVIQLFPDAFERRRLLYPHYDTREVISSAVADILFSMRGLFLQYLTQKLGSVPTDEIYAGTTLTGAIRHRDGGITVFSNGNSPAWVVGEGGSIAQTTPIFVNDSESGYYLIKDEQGRVTIDCCPQQLKIFTLTVEQIEGTTLCLATDGLLKNWRAVEPPKKNQSKKKKPQPKTKEIPKIVYLDPKAETGVIECFQYGHDPQTIIERLETYASTFEVGMDFDDRAAVAIAL